MVQLHTFIFISIQFAHDCGVFEVVNVCACGLNEVCHVRFGNTLYRTCGSLHYQHVEKVQMREHIYVP